jgi:hypothetical protein
MRAGAYHTEAHADCVWHKGVSANVYGSSIEILMHTHIHPQADTGETGDASV